MLHSCSLVAVICSSLDKLGLYIYVHTYIRHCKKEAGVICHKFGDNKVTKGMLRIPLHVKSITLQEGVDLPLNEK